VVSDVGEPSETWPGPDTRLHANVSGVPAALDADPWRVAVLVGRMSVWFAPAETTSVPAGGLTVTCTSLEEASAESLAVSRTT